MSDFVISNADGRKIEFAGSLIGTVERSIECNDGLARKFTLNTYAVDGGGFVAQVEYASHHETERSCSVSERVDSVEDLQKFYFVFEPAEFLSKNRDEPLDRKRLLTRLDAAYVELTHQMLELVDTYASKHGDCEKPIQPKAKSGILGMFGGQE